MAIGYYQIIGWEKVKDSIGFDAVPHQIFHTGTSRNRIRVMFKKYSYQVENASLLKVMYYYSNQEPRDVTKDMRFPELKQLIKKGTGSFS